MGIDLESNGATHNSSVPPLGDCHRNEIGTEDTGERVSTATLVTVAKKLKQLVIKKMWNIDTVIRMIKSCHLAVARGHYAKEVK